ncbi:hypothetical protein EDD68_107113 [Melghiribacillus thermohalophilus]|uniref:Uncharacterized protein n=1 Tax=Melghiribacillus thermohalophilus TaxID=1324956 RepID=A0A4R3N8X7_9BACI|nr:hypothetical protein [Melghiribacillus thermohalophilus]TCT23399.1 hypothetical protein EDD68_107113 [Melghiribacillus thermohalophilus]
MALEDINFTITETRFQERNGEHVTVYYRGENEDRSKIISGSIRVDIEEYDSNSTANGLKELVKAKLSE